MTTSISETTPEERENAIAVLAGFQSRLKNEAALDDLMTQRDLLALSEVVSDI